MIEQTEAGLIVVIFFAIIAGIIFFIYELYRK